MSLVNTRGTRVKINHPFADEISLVSEMGDRTCTEIAFFYNRKWVTDTLIEFAGYSDWSYTSDTLVYRYVPNYLVSAFLVEYAVGNEA
jgi:hypothetical protein